MEGPHTMTPQYTDMQLDALRELANIGSGNAGTALSAMLGHPVDISVPAASALPLADAVEAAGDPESLATGVVLPIWGDINATVLLLFPPDDEETLCNLLGVPAGTEDGRGALGEIGNILGCSYINSLAEMTGLDIEPHPPETVADMVGAIMATVLATQADQTNLALVMDSRLNVEGQECELTFLLLPSLEGIGELLARLGLA
jgi:chemotaxis protein CheC